jgi:hypothetical protein
MDEKLVCYFCGREVTKDDFCWGCHHYICSDCDENELIGNHDVDDHQGDVEE